MRSVLGIDAAWTAHNASGVALVVDKGDGWQLETVAPSYSAFLAASRLPLSEERGAPAALISACRNLIGQAPDLVAVDMPLSLDPISGRRASDNLLTSAYSRMGAGTHSPSAIRPGPISDRMRAEFAALGYQLALSKPEKQALIEVYPHPALIELTGSAYRLPYKISRAGQYWSDLPPAERRQKIIAQWRVIVAALDKEVAGTEALAFPALDATGVFFKAFEDQLDAVICAWVGICVLEGRARAFGDDRSAVWVPNVQNRSQAVGETA